MGTSNLPLAASQIAAVWSALQVASRVLSTLDANAVTAAPWGLVRQTFVLLRATTHLLEVRATQAAYSRLKRTLGLVAGKLLSRNIILRSRM